MITQAIIFLFFGVIKFMLSLLPTVSLPSGIASSITSLFGLYQSIAYFFPMTDVVIFFSTLFALYTLGFSASVLQWIHKKFPGIS